MIFLILKLIFITSCLVWGVKISTEEGMVFEKVGVWATVQTERGYKIWEAIILCPFCMSSFWSLVAIGIAYLLGYDFTWNVFIAYPVIVGGASLVSGFIWVTFQLIVSAGRYFQKLNEED